MQRVKINEEEFREWLQLPVTKYFFQFLQDEAMSARNIVATGGCRSFDTSNTGETYLRLIDRADMIDRIIAVEYEDTIGVLEDASNTSGV
jgi:hypothetical protein